MRELKGIFTIWLREVKKFFRDRPRFFGSIAQPAFYLFVLGVGLSNSIKVFGFGQDGNFLEFMFPGIIGMTVLFTSFFNAISIIWDREFGFLKEVLVSPVSRASIVIGKILGGSTVALIQGLVILVFAPFLKIPLTFYGIIKLIGLMLLTAVPISASGIALASRLKSVQGFQTITNFILMPMFFLSGAMFPLAGAPAWMVFVSKINPLSYGVDAMRYAITPDSRFQLFPLHVDIIVLAVFAMTLGAASVFFFSREE